MEKFIELHTKEGIEVLVNVNIISNVFNGEKGCIVCFSETDYFPTKEDYETVKLMLT